MLKLFKHLKQYWKQIGSIVVLLFIQANADLMLPDYMSSIVSEGIALNNQSIILTKGTQMLGIALIGTACSILVGYLAARVSAGFSSNLRRSVFTTVEGFSSAEFDKFSTASLITRTTNDITQIQMFTVILLRVVFFAPIMGIGGVIKATAKSAQMPNMTWIIVAAVAAILAVIIFVVIYAMPKFKLIQKLVDKLNLVTRERLTGSMVIRAFNTQEYEEKRFDKVNFELTDANLFVNRIMSFLMPFMMLVLNLVSISVIWVGALDAKSMVDIGNMMAFMQYAMQIIMSFLMVSMVTIMMPRASVSATRVAEVIRTKTSINDPLEPKEPIQNMAGTVEFSNVSFSYPGADESVLKNINFTAKSGEVTAIIGSTGTGKSTLINLIPRFYDVTQGRVLVDGIDVREMLQKTLREKLGYVPQKGILFSGTINDNIKFGKENADVKEIETAAQIAQATEFINEKEEGFEAIISQGGTNVSGGQKQRLSIARALAKSPEIYIFDDSFSALDFKTDYALRKALSEKTGNATVFIVAQRINTIMNAEQIIVLDSGEIVGKGTHKELLGNCEVYKEIAYSQLSKEELTY